MLTNLLHLGDLLQAASIGLQGEAALVRHLEALLRNPHAVGDAAQLRLESDANLVQVVTMHKSKGLQYPLVFLPFVSNFRAEKKDSGKPDAERLAEDIRLLYVALTRAEQALWVGLAPLKGDVDGKEPQVKSAVSWLLDRQAEGDLVSRLQAWAGEHIDVQSAPTANAARHVPQTEPQAWRAALTPQRLLQSRWWTASFSALTRDLAQDSGGVLGPLGASDSQAGSARDERIADAQIDSAATDEAAADQPAMQARNDAAGPARFNAFPAGSSYGTLLHDLLEWQARHAWPAATEQSSDAEADADAQASDAEWASLLARKTQAWGWT